VLGLVLVLVIVLVLVRHRPPSPHLCYAPARCGPELHRERLMARPVRLPALPALPALPSLLLLAGVAGCALPAGGLTPEALRPEPVVDRAPGLVAAPPREEILAAGSWDAGVLTRLEALIRSAGRPDLPVSERPVAVLDFDGTCIRNDIGEALLLTAIERRMIVVDEGLLASVPPELGRETLRRDAVRMAELPSVAGLPDPGRDAGLLSWRKALVAVYLRLHEREGGAAAVAWLAGALAGRTPREVRALTRETLAEELARPLGERLLQDGDYDPQPLAVPAGIRYPAEMLDLVAALQRHGFDVWVVSASNQWSVEVGAQRLGIPPHHVVGVRLAADPGGRLTREVLPPLPWGPGKVEAVRAFIGRRPTLVVGNGASDRELLATAAALAVVIAPDEDLRALADEEGWAVQSPFALAP
jgi:phosphoserine phosphatase